MDISVKKLRFYRTSISPIKRLDSVVLFEDVNGKEVVAGDEVEFYKPDEFLPSYGWVENFNGVQIACYSEFLQKWQYHNIIF